MEPHVLDDGAFPKASPTHKRKRWSQRMEAYIGGVTAAAVAVLMILLVYGLMNTGTTTPAWMH
jgi:hypothetical protein